MYDDVRRFRIVEATQSSRWMAFFCSCLECQVKLAGVNSSFRNPPVFLKHAVGGAHERRQAFLEIEVLLGHLFRRNNTPVHVALKLIPRFVTSKPSPSYIRSVVEAFRSGAYNGIMYFGSYGDLGATVARFVYPLRMSLACSPSWLSRSSTFYVCMSELFMQDMSKTEPKVESVNDLRSKRWSFGLA